MNRILITKLHNNFVKNLGNETAEDVVNFIDNKFEMDMENKSEKFSTNEELYNTKTELKEDGYKIRVDLREEMHNMKVDLIKWMVTLWLALALMIMGLYFKK